MSIRRGRVLRRRLLVAAILFILILSPFFAFSPSKAQTHPDTKPLTPQAVKVLVVSPADVYYSGAYFLVADLARYGFNVTHQASDNAVATNYLSDPKTADLSQYDVVIVQGILGFSGSRVSAAEVAHFTDYRGVLILTGNALFQNETSSNWWSFDSEPVRSIEQRLGVDFLGFAGRGGAWHNGGDFDLLNYSINGLPVSLSYEVPSQHNSSICYQTDLTTAETNIIYDFTITNPNPLLIGKIIPGVTFYKSPDGATGIFIQGGYVYGEKSGTYDINYHGLADTSSRSSLLASLITFALGRDISTIIKPQPLAGIRLSGLGYAARWDETYLNASLANFNSVTQAYNITPTIAFAEIPRTFDKDYWKRVVPSILAQLKGEYRDWEYSSSLRSLNTSSMAQSSIEALVQDVKSNYTALGMDLFSTVATSAGLWNMSTLSALASENLYLLDSVDEVTSLVKYSDWWNMKISSDALVHYSARMAKSYEDFDQMGMDLLYYRYFSYRDKWALAVLNGFPSFAYEVPNFRWNEVGTYSLRTVYENLTAEIPDIKFVPLMEAGLYFGNKWMRILNAERVGDVIEFDVDTSLIPEVANIGKGMLWLRIDTNQSIQAVSVDANQWFYFDEHSIRIPATGNTVHIKVTLGTAPSVRVDESRYKVVRASYDGFRFNVSVACPESLNVSVRLFLPKIGPFSKDNWNVFTLEANWNSNFSSPYRTLEFWAVSDGYVSFEVGVFWIVDQSPALYNSDVSISANFSGLELEVIDVTFSYNHDGGGWINSTMFLQNGLYNATIPGMPYGTAVNYRMYVYTAIDKWVSTEIYSYNVADQSAPQVADFEWFPTSPSNGEPVNVKISVSEPESASGVKEVILKYYLGRDITGILQTQSIQMTNENGKWTADIPGQGMGSLVTFYVEAYDNAGNKAETPHESYNVLLPISPLLIAVIAGIIAAVAIGAFLFLRRRRKTTPEVKETESGKMGKETVTKR